MSAKSLILNTLLSLALFCASFYLAWQISAYTKFLYSFWYEVLEIDETISSYAPKNKNRQGFAQTNKQEHVKLFAAIVTGIQNQGDGLAELKYSNSSGKVIDTFLTNAEVIHLKDVSKLVNEFKYLAIIGVLVAVIIFIVMLRSKTKLAKFRHQLIGGLGFIIFFTALIIISGPTRIFYAGHDIIFPDNHQWFFYYEDSLMSTIMKAPILFGPIACILVVLTILCWFLSLVLMQFIENYRYR